MFHVFLSVLGSVIVRNFKDDSFCKVYCCAVFYEHTMDCTLQKVWYNTDDKYRSFLCNQTHMNVDDWIYKPMLTEAKNRLVNWKPIPNVEYIHPLCLRPELQLKSQGKDTENNFPLLTGRTCDTHYENASLTINVRPEAVCEDIFSAISNISWPNFCQDGQTPEWKVDFDVENFDFQKCVPSFTNQAFYKGWNTFSVDVVVNISNFKDVIPDGCILKVFESFDHRITTSAMEAHKQNEKWTTPDMNSDILLYPGIGYLIYTPKSFTLQYESRTERIPSSTSIQTILYPGWNAFALKKNVVVDMLSLDYKRGMFSDGDYVKNVESFDHHSPLHKIDDFQRKNGQWQGSGNQAIPVFQPKVGYLIHVQNEIEFSY